MRREEHIAEAERLLALAADRTFDEERSERYELAAALVHATLAAAMLNAATVVNYGSAVERTS